MVSLSLLAGLLVAGPLCVLANKDDSYYRPGHGNPNINKQMFWGDASNVLEDLSSFSALYVQFHHCAWTQMQYTSSSNNGDGDGDGDGGDGDVEENDYWYMGAVPPFGANVAFSLYGSLKGSSKSSGCSKDTFINSFYTNSGFESFTYAMYKAGMSGFSYQSSYSSACGGGYGVGCDYENGFAVHAYNSDECNPENFSYVKNTMSSFNSAMNKAQCVQIYNSASSSSSYSSSSGSYSGALGLLADSSPCFYQNYWAPDGQCPDPYGILANYQSNFNKGVIASKNNEPYNAYIKDTQKATAMFWVGGVCFAGALLIFLGGCLTRIACSSKPPPKKIVVEKPAPRIISDPVIVSSPTEESYAGVKTDSSDDSSYDPVMAARAGCNASPPIPEHIRQIREGGLRKYLKNVFQT